LGTPLDEFFFRVFRLKGGVKGKLKDLLNFFTLNSSRVEIINREGELEFLSFPRFPHHNFPNNDLKSGFLMNVDRSNPQTKCAFLFENYELIIDQLRMHNMFLKIPFVGLIFKHKDLWSELLLLFSLILNFFLLYGFSDSNDEKYEIYLFDQSAHESYKIVRYIAIVPLITSVFLAFIQIVENFPVAKLRLTLLQSVMALVLC